jgi:hypothetical protein
MNLKFTPSAWDDYLWFQRQDRKLLKRINQLPTFVARRSKELVSRNHCRVTCRDTGLAESTRNIVWFIPSRIRT